MWTSSLLGNIRKTAAEMGELWLGVACAIKVRFFLEEKKSIKSVYVETRISGFWGHKCQYEDECETEAECHKNGKCIDLGGTALPRKQCFCSPGFHGEKCRKRNSVKLPTSLIGLDLNRHTKRVLSDRMTLHYRVIENAN